MPTLKLTRNQFASFLKDAEQIKQFERLFATANSSVTVDAATLDDGDYIYWDATSQTWVAKQPDALTRVNDTNVTLTLAGVPGTALFNPVSITAGWTGELAVARGGTGGGVASGTLLDNITGFSGTGMLVRTGAGTYAFRTDTGTANRITITNGDGLAGNPTFDISASYVGQTSITTLGTITTGVWNGTTVAVANGGTGVTTSTGTTAVVLSNLPQFTSTIGVGTAASASGSGVSFPATQSASTDPNTLDDYEEGTYTPTVTSSGGAITAYTATGKYTKIGNLVTVVANIVITNNGTGSGLINATLPFTAGTGFVPTGSGREDSITGFMQVVIVNSGATVMAILDYAGAYPGGGGTATARNVRATVSYWV